MLTVLKHGVELTMERKLHSATEGREPTGSVWGDFSFAWKSFDTCMLCKVHGFLVLHVVYLQLIAISNNFAVEPNFKIQLRVEVHLAS